MEDNQKYIDNISKQERKSPFLVEMDQLKKDKEVLLNACQMAHRKHTYGDDSVGWEELTGELAQALRDVMGIEGYGKWQDEYNDENE